MPEGLSPGGDPRLALLLARLPGQGVPVLPLDLARIARVLPPGRALDWESARELLVSLLAKDARGRERVRHEFRRCFPPDAQRPPGPGALDAEAAPRSGAGQPPPVGGTRPARPWHRLMRAALLTAALALALPGLRRDAVPLPLPPARGPLPTTATATTTASATPGALPADPLPTFNDWVPVFAPPDPAALIGTWFPPLALLGAGLWGLIPLGRRARRLSAPTAPPPRYDREGEPVFAWSGPDLIPPDPLTGRDRRELVWGVPRYASEHGTPRLDLPGTVAASARDGFPSPRFARARPEREVWLWWDTRLRSAAAPALLAQIERDLGRSGLTVRRAHFAEVPDRLYLADGGQASPPELGAAARRALVCLFTDGRGLARVLDGLPGRDGPARAPGRVRRTLRELAAWPRLCLVDFIAPELDAAALARRLGIARIAPAALPAWLAERPARPPPAPEPPGPYALRLWTAACALPGLTATGPQARALYDALAGPLGLPPVRDLPAPALGRPGPGGPRLDTAERRQVLGDLARWVWEDGRGRPADRGDADACRTLATAIRFWQGRLDAGARRLDRLAGEVTEARAWTHSPAAYEQAIERLLLGLWWGGQRTAAAVRHLYDLHQRRELAPRISERLAELTAHGRDPAGDGGRIVLPWGWDALPEDPADDPPGTARRRLERMGFAGCRFGARRPLDAATLTALGTAAGLVLAGAAGLAERLGSTAGPHRHTALVYDGRLFQGLVMEGHHQGRPYAASRKVFALAPSGAGTRLTWCWSGLPPERADAACRGLYQDPQDPRRVNAQPRGDSVLLRAGSLAEPIRACAPGWPALVVAVIAADPANDTAARRLAVRLLDRGAADLVLIGPDSAEQARALAADWAFVTDSQWLFFAAPGTLTAAQVPAPGTRRALLTGDLQAMARALDFPGARPAADALGGAARVTVLAGEPRLWGGPEVATGPAGIDLVRVCPGTFTMGSPPGGEGHLQSYEEEQPAHPVVLAGFEIARTETTRAQDPEAGGSGAADEPAAVVDWNQARDFCRGLGAGFDLPGEAQWEYAARGGSQEPYPFPSDLAGLCRYANGAGQETGWDWANKACSDPFKAAAPVGRFPPNPLGLYDMHGNVWEWVRDCYDDKTYASRGVQATADPVEDGVGCRWRVLRGGSFDHVPWFLRSADRNWYEPGHRDGIIGFRCVRGSGRQPDN